MSVLLQLVVGGGALFLAVALYLIVQGFIQVKSPQKRVKEFLARANSGPLVHRAGQPENTLSAFRLCKAQGCSGVEVDLMFSQDGHPILMHDDTVDRTSTGSGRVHNLTLKQLKELDVGSKTG